MTGPHPTAFISYSWDNDPHIAWVRELASRLRSDGVDVTLDQWHAVPGDQLPKFMETAIRENDYVLIVCTPNYCTKSDNREGGVGYEGDIITAELFADRNDRKFIPLLRGSNWAESAPSWIKGKFYIPLNGTPYTENAYDDLLATIHNTRPTAPPIGKRPTAANVVSGKPKISIVPDPSEPIKITGILADEVTTPRMDGTRGSALYAVPFKLSRTPPSDWATAFIATWKHPPSYSLRHRPSIARVSGDRIVLDGTTVEEVRDVHRETLILCVKKANELVADFEAKKLRAKQSKEQQEAVHRNKVTDIGSQIEF